MSAFMFYKHPNASNRALRMVTADDALRLELAWKRGERPGLQATGSLIAGYPLFRYVPEEGR